MNGIPHLKEAKDLRVAGGRLGRSGMSERVIVLVTEYLETGPTYKGAMILAGRLKAVAIAAKSDGYWDEQVSKGYHREVQDLPRFSRHKKALDKLVVIITTPFPPQEK